MFRSLSSHRLCFAYHMATSIRLRGTPNAIFQPFPGFKPKAAFVLLAVAVALVEEVVVADVVMTVT